MLDTGRVMGRFPTSNNEALVTYGSIGLGICGKGALKVMKRDNYNGSAFIHVIVSLSGPADKRVLCRKGGLSSLSGGRA